MSLSDGTLDLGAIKGTRSRQPDFDTLEPKRIEAQADDDADQTKTPKENPAAGD